MTDAQAHIEAMQRRIEQMAAREEKLITALDEALSSADRKLLDDVRTLTLEHEARRTIILNELQSLATRVGAFPASAKPVETIEYEAVAATSAEAYPTSEPKIADDLPQSRITADTGASDEDMRFGHYLLPIVFLHCRQLSIEGRIACIRRQRFDPGHTTQLTSCTGH